MKTVILAVLMILSATITHAQDNYSLTKEGNSYICKGSKPCKIDERTTFGSAALWAMEKSSNVLVVILLKTKTLIRFILFNLILL
jgi:hypothetical protein